jgi:single-strand DNA-binding protein
VYASVRFDYNDYTDQNEQRHIGVELIANRIETLDESNIDVTHDARKQPRLLTAWNQATVIGNLTRDAELRHTPASVAVTRLSVAVNDPPTRNNQRPKTHFLDVTLWGALAERYAGLPKGTGVVVRGRVNNDSYTDRSEVRQYTTRIEGIGVQVLTRPGDGQNTDNDRDDGAHAAAETHEQSDSVGVPPDDIF